MPRLGDDRAIVPRPLPRLPAQLPRAVQPRDGRPRDRGCRPLGRRPHPRPPTHCRARPQAAEVAVVSTLY